MLLWILNRQYCVTIQGSYYLWGARPRLGGVLTRTRGYASARSFCLPGCQLLGAACLAFTPREVQCAVAKEQVYPTPVSRLPVYEQATFLTFPIAHRVIGHRNTFSNTFPTLNPQYSARFFKRSKRRPLPRTSDIELYTPSIRLSPSSNRVPFNSPQQCLATLRFQKE